MLDEPTNDLDIDTLRSLEEALGEWDGCAVVVSHDRYFLDRVCTHMLVFHGGGRVQWFAGSYSDYLQVRMGARSRGQGQPRGGGREGCGGRQCDSDGTEPPAAVLARARTGDASTRSAVATLTSPHPRSTLLI